MLCYKLDDTFQPFTSLTPVDDYNEFLYATGGASSNAQAITFDDAGLPWGQGIHVYGSQTGSNYLAAAAFNGYTEFSTCTSSFHNNLASVSQGPAVFANNAVNRLPGLSMCSNFNVTGVNVFVTKTTLCSVAAMPGSGSNNRTTGIGSNTAERSELNIYPNPVTGIARINYSSMNVTTLELYNNLGQKVAVVNTSGSGVKELEIDFKKLKLENGIYYVKATVDGKVAQQKIIYAGE
jgi:hypothetical protein